VALAPLLLLTIVSRWADRLLPWQLAAYLTASLLASAFAVLAVAAVQGLFVVGAPRGRALAMSAVVRSLMLCGLMLGLPLVGRLPAAAEAFARGATWLYVVPPAWFVRLERLLLGDTRPQIVHLAEIAALAFALAAAVVAVSYATLYRDFDRLIVRPAASPPHAREGVEPAGRVTLRARAVSNPVFLATRTFTAVTLRRSVLHQGIVVALSTIGGGLVVNSVLAASPGEWLRHGSPSRPIIEAIVWAPFALMYAAARAVRLGLAVPIEQRANWIFRMTESELSGPQHLRAAVHTIGSLGILVPVAVTFPFQWLALGVLALAAAAAALLCGWLYVELLTKDWDRVPFTCSYIPGKSFVPQAIITGAVSFVLFTTLGAALARGCAGGHPAAYVFLGCVALGAAILRRRRLDAWRTTPLQFEDVLPTDVNPLRLSAD
jgi:hypothetical protein